MKIVPISLMLVALLFAAPPAVSAQQNMRPSESGRAQERKIALFKLPPIGGAVMTLDTKKLIVSLPSEGKLAYFDLMKDQEIKRLALDFRPGVMALQGKKLIVATQGSPVLHVLDLESLEELKSIKLPGEPIQSLACHPTKGLIYALNFRYEVYSLDIVAGTGHKTKARGDMIAVDPAGGKFVYAGLLRPIPDVPALAKVKDSALLLQYTVSGAELVLHASNNNAAIAGGLYDERALDRRKAKQFGLGLSPDGKQVALAALYPWGKNVESPGGIGIFETSDMKKLVGVVQPGDGQKAIAFHPVLSMGSICTAGQLVLFNSKSKILANIEKIVLPEFDARSDMPVYLDFGAFGAKAIICPLGIPPFSNANEVILRFVPLTLSEEDTNILKKAHGETSELKKGPSK